MDASGYRTWGGAQVFFFNIACQGVLVCYALKVTTGEPHDPGLRLRSQDPSTGLG
jgi:hypothetical protein